MPPQKEQFLFPLIYTGPRERASKTVTVPGTREPLTFKVRPDSPIGADGLPERIAYVTEEQGRWLVKRHGSLYAWPAGVQFGPQVPTLAQFEALLARVEAIEAHLGIVPVDLPVITDAELEASLDEPAKPKGKGGRKPKVVEMPPAPEMTPAEVAARGAALRDAAKSIPVETFDDSDLGDLDDDLPPEDPAS